MGGVFNYVNLHVYHYAGNNPVKYTDPDGNDLNTWISSWMAEPDPQGGKSINQNAPQRRFGYSSWMETSVFVKNDQFANIDTVSYYFNDSGGNSVQLWFWKGNYNLADKKSWDAGEGLKFEWHIGGEIGSYTGKGEALDGLLVSSNFSLFIQGSDTSFLTRSKNGEFWPNGFLSGKATGPSSIKMIGQLNFKNEDEAKSFENAFRRDFPGNGSNNLIFNMSRKGATIDFTFE
jgi:hypothetical protein